MERNLTLVRAAWPRALPLLGLVAIAGAAIWPAWPPLVETWRVMPEYSYSLLLVPFIACWIAARSIELPPPVVGIAPLGAGILLVSLVAWLVAYKASSAIGQQLMIPVVLWSAVWTAFGLPIARRLAAPLACLYFAIPVWEFVVPFLQTAAVWVSETVLGLIGVPVHIDGDLVSIPEGTFRIAEACAGRRYLIVCITVAALIAGTSRMRPSRAAAFLTISAALSILTNWIRVLTVIYAGHITNMTSYLVVKEHLTLGWALFAVLMVGVCLLGTRFARTGALPPFVSDRAAAGGGARELLRRPALPATALVLLMPALAIAYSRHESAVPADRATTLSLPPMIAEWAGRPSDSTWRPRYPGAAGRGQGTYVGRLGELQVFAAEYLREERGAKLVSSADALYPEDWMVLGSGSLRDDPMHPRVVRLETPTGAHWLVSYLYRVGPIVTANAVIAQLAYGVLAWTGPTPTRIVAVATRCGSSCDAANERLADFWRAGGASLLPAGRTRM